MPYFSDLTKTICFLVVIGILIAFAWAMKKFFYFLPNSVPRKFLHVTAITIAALSYIFIKNETYIIALGLLILFGNYAMVKMKLFEEKDPGKTNYGIFLVPISYLFLLFAFRSQREIAMMGMLVMAYADGFAALIGENFPYKPYKLGKSSKSIGGSLTFFLVSFAVFYFAFAFVPLDNAEVYSFTDSEILVYAVYFALFLTLVEALSFKGMDNFLIPVISSYLLYVFLVLNFAPQIIQLLVAILFVALVIWTSAKFEFLTKDGSVAAAVIGLFIFGLGGWKWSVPLLTFFFLSSFLSKLPKNKNQYFEKGDKRDAAQVFANGIVPLLVFALSLIIREGNDIFYFIYLTALGAAAADTWATEIGNLKIRKTFSVIGFYEVEQGISGGVSLGGTVGGFLGALSVILSGYFWISSGNCYLMALSLASAFSGMVLDSFLGALWQRKNICTVCDKITERKIHCGKPTKYYSGIKWLNNDAVNLISIAVSSLLYFVIYYAVVV